MLDSFYPMILAIFEHFNLKIHKTWQHIIYKILQKSKDNLQHKIEV